jgi:hypothetical protein
MVKDKAHETCLKEMVFRNLHEAPFTGLRKSTRTQTRADIQSFDNDLGRAGLDLKVWFDDEDDCRDRLFVVPSMLSFQ